MERRCPPVKPTGQNLRKRSLSLLQVLMIGLIPLAFLGTGIAVEHIQHISLRHALQHGGDELSEKILSVPVKYYDSSP